MKRPIAHIVVVPMAMAAGLRTTEARAEPLTFHFAGYIDTVVDIGLDESVTIGTPFSGSYTFEPVGAMDSSPENPSLGYYGFLSPSRFSVTVGSYEFTTNDLLIGVFDNILTGDHYDVHNWSDFYSNGLAWNVMGIFLSDYTRTALESDALPLTPPELADFTSYARFSAGSPGHLGPVMRGPLTSLTPEPGSLAILGLGTAIILVRRTRR